MDGRRFRKWLLTGCLAAGAVGCNRNAVRSPWDPPGAIEAAKRSANSSGGTSALPVEVAAEPVRKGPPLPETTVAFADVQLQAALEEGTPNRQELLDAARQGYQKALQQDPKNKAAQLGLARFYTRIGDRERAVEVFKKYLDANRTDKDVAHEVALAHAQWKDWAGAVSWCDFALRMDPENLSVRKTKAFCLARAGRAEEGFSVMREVMPEAQARYLIARVLEHQNQAAACRQQLHLALRADPNHADAREFLAELDMIQSGALPDTNALRQAGYVQQP